MTPYMTNEHLAPVALANLFSPLLIMRGLCATHFIALPKKLGVRRNSNAGTRVTSKFVFTIYSHS